MAEDEKKSGEGTSPKGGPRLNIKVSDDAGRGVYANLVAVHNNEMDFIFDFIFVEPRRSQGQLVSRVVANPRTAKRLLKGLTELVRLYEGRFGEITLPDGATPRGKYH